MDQTVFEILEFLRPYGLATKKDIAPILNAKFKKINSKEFNDHLPAIGALTRFLEALSDKNKNGGYLDFDPSLIGQISNHQSFSNTYYNTFNASITQAGINALNAEKDRVRQEEVNQSAISVNTSIVATNKAIVQTNSLMLNHAFKQDGLIERQVTLVERQNRLYCITLALTGVNIIIGLGILIATFLSNADKEAISTQQSQLELQRREIKKLQIQKSDTVHYVLHYPVPKNKKK